MPADHPLATSFDLNTYFMTEVQSFCTYAAVELDGKVPLDKFRTYLQSDRIVEKLFAITCLSYLGNADDVASLEALSTDETPIAGWGTQVEPETLGAFAASAAKAHPERSEVTKQQLERARTQN